MAGRAAVSRRRFLGVAGAGAVGAGAVGLGGLALAQAGGGVAADAGAPVPFHGPHQSGITTAAQDRLHFVAFDVTTSDRSELRALLAEWTRAAGRMTRGQDAGPVGAVAGRPDAPPDDTGEAIGLPPAALTLTVGFGPSLFDDRFGLGSRRPAALVDLPAFPGDDLDPARSGGDLCVQACSNDPQVAVHAVRNLARIGHGTVAVRWAQLGFGRTSATTAAQQTPRNLFGFKDGTANLRAEEAAELDRHLWVQPGDGADWMVGGTYLVARRIRMHVETWDRTSLREQEAIVGRTKGSGAPLGGRAEHDQPDLAATGDDGQPVVPAAAHVRLAHPSQHGGARMLRRGYTYVDGADGLGRLDAGLFFLAFQRDPRTAFVPVQSALARSDAMNEYLRHVGSAVFACPPGVRTEGDAWGAGLLA